MTLSPPLSPLGTWFIIRAPQTPGARPQPRHPYATMAEAEQAAQVMADKTGVDFLVLGPVRRATPRDSTTPQLL
jgi:hypothetical protein